MYGTLSTTLSTSYEVTMLKNDKIKSNIIGLDMGLVLGRFFLNTEDLHFGYWPEGEKPTSQNFAWAQKNHSKLITDNIPENTTILPPGSYTNFDGFEILEYDYPLISAGSTKEVITAYIAGNSLDDLQLVYDRIFNNWLSIVYYLPVGFYLYKFLIVYHLLW